MLVVADLDEFWTEAAEDRNGAEIGRRTDRDRIALIEQQAADQLEPVLRAVHDQHVLRSQPAAVLVHVARQPGAQLRMTLRRRVLQRFVAMRGQCREGKAAQVRQQLRRGEAGIQSDHAGIQLRGKMRRGKAGGQLRRAPGQWR
jgi:hypothetical protein